MVAPGQANTTINQLTAAASADLTSTVNVAVETAAGSTLNATLALLATTVGSLLGLGTMASQNANAVAITGGNISSAVTAGWQFISSTPITAVANIDFTGLQAGYDYLFSIRNAVPASAVALRWRVSQGGVFDTGSNYLIPGSAPGTNSTSGSFAQANIVNATLTSGGMDSEVVLHNPGSSTEYKSVNELTLYINSAPIMAVTVGGSRYMANTNAVDGFRIFFNGQNFQAQGSIIVFRRRLS